MREIRVRHFIRQHWKWWHEVNCSLRLESCGTWRRVTELKFTDLEGIRVCRCVNTRSMSVDTRLYGVACQKAKTFAVTDMAKINTTWTSLKVCVSKHVRSLSDVLIVLEVFALLGSCALFIDIYRRFGTDYQSNLRVLLDLWGWDKGAVPKRRWLTTKQRCLTSQKSE